MEPKAALNNAGAEPAQVVGGARVKPGSHVDMEKGRQPM